MANQYVNKVVKSDGTTIIDITDTTAVASDVAQGKYIYLATGQKVVGTSSGGGTTEVTISTSGAVTQELQPDTVYHFTSTALTSLTITLAQSTGQYHFDFISPATAVVLTLPSGVEMPPTFGVEANTKYEIDIVDSYGVAAEWIYEVV